jgi:hypothetical protein
MKEITKNIIYPISMIVLINVIMHGCFFIAIERPIFYYEYLALPFIFTLIPNNKLRWLALSLTLLGDVVVSLARFYFFDSFNYITKIPSIFFSHFSFSFWIILILGVVLFSYLVYAIVKGWGLIVNDLTNKADRKKWKLFYLKFLFICFIIIYSIDIKTGNSFFNFKTIGNNHTNFSQSLLVQYYNDAKIFSKRYSPVNEMQDYHNGSISYKYLKADSSHHQVLIVLESWGYINDATIRNSQLQDLLQLKNKGYQVIMDSSTFQGGTSQAEARELLNKTGEAYYSIIQNLPNKVNSIIDLKNKEGYYSTALQSFSGFHSSGYLFRKSLGFSSIKELSFFKDSLHHPLNYNNHYEAVNDEVVFDYGIQNAFSHPKSFTYLLTINTHLPFNGAINNKITNEAEIKALPTKESLGQYCRLKEQFKAIALLLEKYPIDKLVIVGDHPAPFVNTNERDFYSKKWVPAIIIKKVL